MELRSVCRKIGDTNYKCGCRHSNGSNDADAVIIVKISTTEHNPRKSCLIMDWCLQLWSVIRAIA